MRKILVSAGVIVGLGAAAFLAGSSSTQARDYGQTGEAFPVIEPDLLSAIEARLRHAEATGELARTNEMFAKRVETKVRRPTPVAGITPAQETRSWDFDPSIMIERDIQDHKRNLVARAGQRINPLDFVSIKQDLVFVDGDNPDQLNWATRRYGDLKAKIIFVSGSPIDEMTRRQRRFYFDQEGKLTGRFGIEHTPAIVTQNGRVMRVTEQVVKPARAG